MTFIPDSSAKQQHCVTPFPSRKNKAELDFCGETSAVIPQTVKVYGRTSQQQCCLTLSIRQSVLPEAGNLKEEELSIQIIWGFAYIFKPSQHDTIFKKLFGFG